MRFGVERPEDSLTPASAPELVGREIAVGGRADDGGDNVCGEFSFIEDCLGGEREREEDVWMAFVKRREMDAVAVDISDSGTGGAGIKASGRRRSARLPLCAVDCSSRILRRDWMVCFARGRLSEPEEGDDDSSR
jgi:hypothetical protein